METIYNTDNNYCKYSGQSDSQGAYVEIDCQNETLSSSYNSDIGFAVPFSVHFGHDQRFGISEYLTRDAINALLDQITPLAERVIAGYDSEWNGNNHVAKFTDDAQEAIEKMEQICHEYDGETFDVYSWDDWFQWNYIPDIVKKYTSIAEMEEGEEQNGTLIYGDLETFLKERIEYCNDDEKNDYPIWLLQELDLNLEDRPLNTVELGDTLNKIFNNRTNEITVRHCRRFDKILSEHGIHYADRDSESFPDEATVLFEATETLFWLTKGDKK